MNDRLIEKMILKCLANYFGDGLHPLSDQELHNLKNKVHEVLNISNETEVFLIVEDVVYDYIKEGSDS